MAQNRSQNATVLILVLEDDVYSRENIQEILEYYGFQVLTARHGLAGLELLSTHERLPDLIVSDLDMPQMDGCEFLKAVRANPKWQAIPLIFLTAAGRVTDCQSVDLKIDGYIKKPFDAEGLLADIQRFL
jgi:CheY-like chemotaxis protein